MNEIKAHCSLAQRKSTTQKLYQYDYGQYLDIVGIDLPNTFEAHFAHDGDTETKTVLGESNKVKIPDEYLKKGKDITCYIYLHTGEEDGETEYKITIPVIPRETPTDIEPTPQEEALIDQLITALNTGVEQAEDYADTAEECAQQAIEVLRDINQTVADALQEAKDSGEFDGRGIESTVFNSDYTLTLNFTDGTSFTTPSLKGEKGEKGDKGENTAYLAFSQPPILRRVRGTQIQAGSVSMTFAAYKDGERIPCVGTSLASADWTVTTVNATTTSDGTITVAWDSGFDPLSPTTSAFSYKFDFDGISYVHYMKVNKVYDGAKGDKGDPGEVSEAELEQTKYSLAPVIVDTANGTIASISDGADGYPVKSLVVSIEPIQEGTGDPSPTNIRPITGWTDCEVTQTGFNQWDEEWEVGSISNTTGENTTSSNYFRAKNLIRVVSSAIYHFKTSGDSLYRYWYDADKNLITYSGGIVDNNDTIPNNACYMRFVDVSRNSYNSASKPICINISSDRNGDYKPYNGTTYSTALGSTVYGGTLDVVSGVLTVENVTVDMGTLNWAVETINGHVRFNAIVTNIAPIPSDTLAGYADGLICSAYVADGHPIANNSVNGAIAKYSGRVYVRNDAYSDATAFKTAMNGMQLVYKVATPTTYNLTPTEIRSLLGDNNVWANTGNVAVTYCADTKLYINKIMEE